MAEVAVDVMPPQPVSEEGGLLALAPGQSLDQLQLGGHGAARVEPDVVQQGRGLAVDGGLGVPGQQVPRQAAHQHAGHGGDLGQPAHRQHRPRTAPGRAQQGDAAEQGVEGGEHRCRDEARGPAGAAGGQQHHHQGQAAGEQRQRTAGHPQQPSPTARHPRQAAQGDQQQQAGGNRQDARPARHPGASLPGGAGPGVMGQGVEGDGHQRQRRGEAQARCLVEPAQQAEPGQQAGEGGVGHHQAAQRVGHAQQMGDQPGAAEQGEGGGDHQQADVQGHIADAVG